MKKRSLDELNLLDDFLFQELVSRGKKGEDFCRILLTTILGKKIKGNTSKTNIGKRYEFAWNSFGCICRGS